MNIKAIEINKDLDVLTIVGPTASGKTALAIAIAKQLNGEIISGDAYQIYRKMDIGTAKVTKQEMDYIVHHMIDIVDYDQEFNVMIFQSMVRDLIKDIKSRGKLPIIAGGTGLYIQAVLYQYEFNENTQYQTLKLENELKPLKELQQYCINNKLQLNESDYGNHKRLVVKVTKKMLNLEDTNNALIPFYNNFQIICLDIERDILYQRIDNRVDVMITLGLEKEVKQFNPTPNSQLAIGYKEFHQYFRGDITYEQTIIMIKQKSRNFAKRQMSWFRTKAGITHYQLEGDTWKLIQN